MTRAKTHTRWYRLIPLLAVGACSASRGDTSAPRTIAEARQPSAKPVDASSPAAPLEANDSTIAQAVGRQLERAGGIPAGWIDVTVRDGIVALSGRVSRGEEAHRAVELAEWTRGVRAVLNHLEVAPEPTLQTELTTQVRAALHEAGTPDSRELRVTAQAGKVTLEGVVRSLAERESAERAAWFVDGVREVDNQIRVLGEPTRSDEDIRSTLEARFATDAYLAHDAIGVSVKDGVVELTGGVGSAFERARARRLSAIAGVTDIRDTLTVSAVGMPAIRHAAALPSDEQQRQAILDAYALDPRVPDKGIDVRVKSGVVELSGVVGSLAQRLAAQEDAQNAAGSWAVNNTLQVRTDGPLNPSDLRTRILQRLRQHPSISARTLEVTTQGSAVVLSGKVLNEFERRTAEKVTALQPGVSRVDNRLELTAQPRNVRDDHAIERDIETELWWDTRVDSSKIDVQVREGVATIAGEVENWEVYNAVLENVFEAAPREVVNHLQRRKPEQLIRMESTPRGTVGMPANAR